MAGAADEAIDRFRQQPGVAQSSLRLVRNKTLAQRALARSFLEERLSHKKSTVSQNGLGLF